MFNFNSTFQVYCPRNQMLNNAGSVIIPPMRSSTLPNVSRSCHSKLFLGLVYVLHKHPGRDAIAFCEHAANIMRACKCGGVFSLVSSRRWSQFANSPRFPVFHLTLACSQTASHRDHRLLFCFYYRILSLQLNL